MQISTQQSQQDYSRMVRRLEQLLQDIPRTDTYTQLHKCSKQLEKAKESLSNIDRHTRKELRLTLKKCEELIHKKTLFFTKKQLEKKPLSTEQENDPLHRKTLKCCRSADNLALGATYSKFPVSDCSEMDKTEVRDQQLTRQQREIDQLREGLSLLREVRGNESQSTLSRLKIREVEDQFAKEAGAKMREKGLELEELRGRVKHLQESNQQLKNRLLNEQRRQQDYISNLRSHLSEANFKLETSIRDRMRLEEELSKYVTLCNDLRNDTKALTQEVTLLHKQRRQSKNNQILKMKESNIRREADLIQTQEKRIRELQATIAAQRDEKSLLQQTIQTLNKRLIGLEGELDEENTVKERLKEEIDIKNEQIDSLGKELITSIDARKQAEEETREVRDAYANLKQELEGDRERRNLQKQRKYDSLKQMRELLTMH